MSFLSSISNYFGGNSSKNFEKAATHLSNAKNILFNSGAVEDKKSTIEVEDKKNTNKEESGSFPYKSVSVLGGLSYVAYSYEYIAGKAIVANTAVQAVKTVAEFFGGGSSVLSAMAATTKFVAGSLVFAPLQSFAVIAATTIIATHPKETLEVVKGLSTAAYKLLATTGEVILAGVEASIGLVKEGANVLGMFTSDSIGALDIDGNEFVKAMGDLGGMTSEVA
jgi:hypothetical protein